MMSRANFDFLKQAIEQEFSSYAAERDSSSLSNQELEPQPDDRHCAFCFVTIPAADVKRCGKCHRRLLQPTVSKERLETKM